MECGGSAGAVARQALGEPSELAITELAITEGAITGGAITGSRSPRCDHRDRHHQVVGFGCSSGVGRCRERAAVRDMVDIANGPLWTLSVPGGPSRHGWCRERAFRGIRPLPWALRARPRSGPHRRDSATRPTPKDVQFRPLSLDPPMVFPGVCPPRTAWRAKPASRAWRAALAPRGAGFGSWRDVLRVPFKTLNALKGTLKASQLSRKRPSRARHPAGGRCAPLACRTRSGPDQAPPSARRGTAVRPSVDSG